MITDKCLAEGCGRPFHAKGYCSLHYSRWKNHGSPHVCKALCVRGSPTQRFLARVRVGDGCWEFNAFSNDGYKRFRIGNRLIKVHRFAYELLVGQIPDGLVLDHLCRNRGCCNPSHLEPVTTGENTRRAWVYSQARIRNSKRGLGNA